MHSVPGHPYEFIMITLCNYSVPRLVTARALDQAARAREPCVVFAFILFGPARCHANCPLQSPTIVETFRPLGTTSIPPLLGYVKV